MRPRILVLTGAGISAESGLPTFRGAGGLWEGRRVEDVATPRAWRAEPHAVWRFYQLRRAALGTVQPNAAHAALAQLERRCRARGVEFALITQNVDDLHERAGSAPSHIHGELAVLRCERCGARVRDLEHLDPERFVPCASCGEPRLRPDVVWFGELPYGWGEAEALAAAATVFLSIGTSGLVYPAAGLLAVARESGARTVVNSLDEPGNLAAPDEFRPGAAGAVVPELCAEIERMLP